MSDIMYDYNDYLAALEENPNMSALEQAIWTKKLFDTNKVLPSQMRRSDVGYDAITQAEHAGHNAIQDNIHNEMRNTGYSWDTYNDFGTRHTGEFSIPGTDVFISTTAGYQPNVHNIIENDGERVYTGPQLIDDELELADINKLIKLAKSPNGWMRYLDFDKRAFADDELNQWKYIKSDIDSPIKVAAASIHNQVLGDRQWWDKVPTMRVRQMLESDNPEERAEAERRMADYESHQPLNQWGQLVKGIREEQKSPVKILGAMSGTTPLAPSLDFSTFEPGVMDDAKLQQIDNIYQYLIDMDGGEKEHKQFGPDHYAKQEQLANALGLQETESPFKFKGVVDPSKYYRVPGTNHGYFSLTQGFPDMINVVPKEGGGTYYAYPNMFVSDVMNVDEWNKPSAYIPFERNAIINSILTSGNGELDRWDALKERYSSPEKLANNWDFHRKPSFGPMPEYFDSKQAGLSFTDEDWAELEEQNIFNGPSYLEYIKRVYPEQYKQMQMDSINGKGVPKGATDLMSFDSDKWAQEYLDPNNENAAIEKVQSYYQPDIERAEFRGDYKTAEFLTNQMIKELDPYIKKGLLEVVSVPNRRGVPVLRVIGKAANSTTKELQKGKR